MRHSPLAALALALAWSGSLSAQSADLRIGRQVRVSAPAQRIYAETLTLLAATPVTITLGSIALWRDAGQGALVGGGLGLTLRALAGALSSKVTWVSVPIDGLRALHLGLVPRRGGRLGVRLGTTF